MVLNFLLSSDTLPQLARLRRNTLLKIPSVGVKCVSIIEGWQERAHFSQEVDWVGEMIQEDAKRCLELDEKIKRLETKIAATFLLWGRTKARSLISPER